MNKIRPLFTKALRTTVLLVIQGICLLAGISQATGNQPPAVTVTFISNCGFLLEGGGQKILFDLEAPGKSGPSPGLAKVYELLKANEPPFDDIPVLLISHPHPDHLATGPILDYLGRHPRTRLYSTADTRDELQKADPAVFEKIRNQLVLLDPYEQNPTTVKLDGLTLDVIGTWHAAAPAYRLKDLCFALNLNGLDILYLSDVDPGFAENLPVLQRWQARHPKVDLLLVPEASLYENQWSSATGVAFIRSLQARHLVAMHVDPREYVTAVEKVRANFPEAVFFRESLEKKTFR